MTTFSKESRKIPTQLTSVSIAKSAEYPMLTRESMMGRHEARGGVGREGGEGVGQRVAQDALYPVPPTGVSKQNMEKSIEEAPGVRWRSATLTKWERVISNNK
jgi:hypothetical protein